MFGYGVGHYPNISPVGAPPHIGPVTTCCRPLPVVPVCTGVGIIFIAVLILVALGVIF
ncbi:hypothetical protein [Desulfosporosinus sp. FKB]|uniref:hypothetical protein n=1 Tax=Desulfosporosinus sp. FKB TaxID=1969835 RepID=UPI0014829686|nr:hypothetical protein [Desulfosporosinus sp. FKB]